jgi:hypothetical protein
MLTRLEDRKSSALSASSQRILGKEIIISCKPYHYFYSKFPRARSSSNVVAIIYIFLLLIFCINFSSESLGHSPKNGHQMRVVLGLKLVSLKFFKNFELKRIKK